MKVVVITWGSDRYIASKDELLKQINIGWINYYGIAKCKGILEKLDKWIRQRLRICIWKQWKKVKTRYKNLKKLGLKH